MQYADPGQSPAVDSLLNQRFTATSAPTQDIACNTLTYVSARKGLPTQIGPGIWDIHSPRIPDADEMSELLALARTRLKDWQIWVNPDCGLKTRGWEEVRPALVNLVAAARRLRNTVMEQASN